MMEPVQTAEESRTTLDESVPDNPLKGNDSRPLGESLLIRTAAVTICALIYQLLTLFERRVVWVQGEAYRLLPDDVMITLRVAHNISLGHGPYFNPGEHVAANTSLFWPYCLAPIIKPSSLSESVERVQWLSLALVTAIFFAVVVLPRKLSVGLLSATLLLSSSSLILYGSSGWEHVPQTLLITVALITVWQAEDKKLLSVASYSLALVSLAFLLRPDAIFVAIPIAILVILKAVKLRKYWHLLSVALFSLTVLAHFLVHRMIYGDFFPNTYYLKVGHSETAVIDGIKYLIKNLYDGGNTLILALLAIAFFLSPRQARRVNVVVPLLSVLLFISYTVLVGGDVFAGGRFLLAVTPFAAFAMVDLAAGLDFVRMRSIFPRAIIVALTFCVTIQLSRSLRPILAQTDVDGSYRMEDSIASQLALIPAVREHIKPEDGQIGLFFLGTLSYYLPEYAFADFLGKADPVVARSRSRGGPVGHNKWDYTHSLISRNVSVVPFKNMPDELAEKRVQLKGPFWFWADFQQDVNVKDGYEFLSPLDVKSKGAWGLFVRKDLVPRFQ